MMQVTEKNIKKLAEGWLFPVPERAPAFGFPEHKVK